MRLVLILSLVSLGALSFGIFPDIAIMPSISVGLVVAISSLLALACAILLSPDH